MSRFEKHPVLTILSVLVFFSILALTAAEWLLSTGSSHDVVHVHESLPRPERHLRLREWLPGTTFLAAPPAIRREADPDSTLPLYELSTDGDGFIRPSGVHATADLRIIFLGGSTTENLYVIPEDRFPHLTARLLEQRLNLKVNAYNAAKSGNNVMHSTLTMIGKGLPKRPDFVVLMHNVNDLALLSRRHTYWTDEASFALVERRDRTPESIFRDLRDITIPRTYRWLKRRLRNLREVVSLGIAHAAAAEAAAVDQHGKMFGNALTQFVWTAKAWGIRPVLMTQVVAKQPDKSTPASPGDYLGNAALRRGGFTAASFASAHDYFNAIIRSIALQHDAVLVDLAAQDWEPSDLYDGLHFTDRGSRKAARRIADTLSGLLAR